MLTTVQPGDGGQVGKLLVGEHGSAPTPRCSGCVRRSSKRCQAARLAYPCRRTIRQHAGRQPVLGADGHHHVHVASLHQLLADVLIFVARIRGAGGHDEPGTSVVVQVAIEILKPRLLALEMVSPSPLFLPLVFVATPGKPNGTCQIAFHQPGF